MKLENKVAIVTGAGRGIGAALACGFAREGASVVVDYAHSDTAAREVVDRIRGEGGRAIAVRADVACLEEHTALLDAARQQFGRLDVLVNNAAIEIRARLFDVTPEQWDRIQSTDLRGPFFLAQAAARYMSRNGGGAILNISSVHDEQAHRNNAVYSIAKSGVKMMTRCLALELAEHGIRVNCLAPGAFRTDINREVLRDRCFEEKVLQEIPLRRIGEPDELVAAAVLLVSSEASYITGSTLYVDGGLLL